MLLQPLRRIAEEAHDALDGLLHPIEILEGGIDLDRAVEKDAAKALVPGGIEDPGFADGMHQTFRRGGEQHGIVTTGLQVSRKRQFRFLALLVFPCVLSNQGFCGIHNVVTSSSGRSVWP